MIHSSKETIESSDFRIETTWEEQIEDQSYGMANDFLGKSTAMKE